MLFDNSVICVDAARLAEFEVDFLDEGSEIRFADLDGEGLESVMADTCCAETGSVGECVCKMIVFDLAVYDARCLTDDDERVALYVQGGQDKR